jgi:hypothetical protein
MLISRISLRISNGTVGLPPSAFDFQRQYNRKPARCHLTTVSGLTIVSASRIYLLPQRQNFRLERCPRPKQIHDHPNNEPDKISHPATASPDSPSTASQIEFTTGTGHAHLDLVDVC